jgi:hypothetical protein
MAHGTKFSEAELAKLAERFGRGEVEPVGDPQTIEHEVSGGTTVLSVRLPRSAVSQLKALAEQRGIGATVFARDLIIAGLAAEPGGLTGAVPVEELLHLISAHGRAETTADNSPSRVPAKKAARSQSAAALSQRRVTKKAAPTSHGQRTKPSSASPPNDASSQ